MGEIEPFGDDSLFSLINPVLDIENAKYTTKDEDELYIGQNNNARIITPAYISIAPKRSIFTRGKETTPTTLMIEIVPKTATAGRKYLFINGETGLNQFLQYVTAYLVFRQHGTANYGTIAQGGALMDTTKKYVVCLTYNGDKMSATPIALYYNGVKIVATIEKSVTEVMEFANTGTNFTLGNTVAGLEFQVTRATAWDTELSAEDIATCNFDCNESNKVIDILATQGNGATVHNLLETGNNGTITNATLSTVWGTPSDVLTPWNEYKGFSLYKNDSDPTIHIRVPYKNDGTPNNPTISGYTFVRNHPAGEWFNDSESYFKLEDTTIGSDLMLADANEIFFDHSTGKAKWFNIRDVYSKNRGFFYIDAGNISKKRKLIIYKTDKTLQNDVDVLLWCEMDDIIVRDEETKEITFDILTDHAVLDSTKTNINYTGEEA